MASFFSGLKELLFGSPTKVHGEADSDSSSPNPKKRKLNTGDDSDEYDFKLFSSRKIKENFNGSVWC
jgi:hypothetical protein